jgi:hypothetical protein
VWGASAGGDQTEIFDLLTALTRRSDGWINRIGRLARGAARGGVEIDLPGGGADEGNERL